MAIFCTLELEADEDGDRLADSVRRAHAGLVLSSRSGCQPPTISAVGPDRTSAELIREAYRFSPKVSLVIHLGKPVESESVNHVIRATIHEIAELDGAAVLLMNGEIPMYLRRDASLVLNSDFRQWDLAEWGRELRGFEVTCMALPQL